jgi:hypothetical protein
MSFRYHASALLHRGSVTQNQAHIMQCLAQQLAGPLHDGDWDMHYVTMLRNGQAEVIDDISPNLD